eukprot:CAMPEP_0119517270 /NCGR_PEP_ID=MMETSP1344-20130328/34214_1 /TAXON_ID=236787 /ORGANISM="Florenciella parvula, Strain CCMP2471" /LENGTH=30 /DNA_ID= /DNA_START= /DNA_END= /DNA_ORIENTATION=
MGEEAHAEAESAASGSDTLTPDNTTDEPSS